MPIAFNLNDMKILGFMASCLCGTEFDNYPLYPSGKPRIRSGIHPAQKTSDRVVELLCVAEKNGPILRHQISDAVGNDGWTENIASAIVASLERIFKEGRENIGSALSECIDKAENAATEVFAFPHEHPYLTAGFATIIAVGILTLVAPWAVEALDFAELGPVAGMVYTSFSLLEIYKLIEPQIHSRPGGNPYTRDLFRKALYSASSRDSVWFGDDLKKCSCISMMST